VIVRHATPADVPAILRLIVALAVFEREPDAVKATEDTLMRSLFGDEAHVFAHVAELDGEVVGTAVWFLNYSTWTGRPGIYLEDLFVSEAAIKQHLLKLYEKFGIRAGGDRRRVQLANEALRRGAVSFSEVRDILR